MRKLKTSENILLHSIVKLPREDFFLLNKLSILNILFVFLEYLISEFSEKEEAQEKICSLDFKENCRKKQNKRPRKNSLVCEFIKIFERILINLTLVIYIEMKYEPVDSDDDYSQATATLYHKSKACGEHARVVADFLDRKSWLLNKNSVACPAFESLLELDVKKSNLGDSSFSSETSGSDSSVLDSKSKELLKVRYYKSKTACNFERILPHLEVETKTVENVRSQELGVTESDIQDMELEMKAYIYAKLSLHVFENLIGECKQKYAVSKVYEGISDERFEEVSRTILSDLEQLPGYKFIVNLHSCVDAIDCACPVFGFSKSVDFDNGDFEISYVFNWDLLYVLAVVFAVKV